MDLQKILEDEILTEMAAIKKQQKADKEKYAELKEIQAKLNETNLKELEKRRQRPADQTIGTTAVDNVYTDIEKPAVDFTGLEYLFEKTLKDNGWIDDKMTLIIGLTAAGVILDIVDLAAAVMAGDIIGIITSTAGFLPLGDLLKAYKKTEAAVQNAPNVSTGSVDNIVSNIDGKTANAGLTNNNSVNITDAGSGVQPIKTTQTDNLTTQTTTQTTTETETPIAAPIQAGRRYQVLT